ncbi:hypothetical protein BC830DRAFT_1107636 [Chytriomyces sp. MP71]|nr:hypothetical protein BC830DRAFT_1107636 [Chytriomyces sp. MP71]
MWRTIRIVKSDCCQEPTHSTMPASNQRRIANSPQNAPQQGNDLDAITKLDPAFRASLLENLRRISEGFQLAQRRLEETIELLASVSPVDAAVVAVAPKGPPPETPVMSGAISNSWVGGDALTLPPPRKFGYSVLTDKKLSVVASHVGRGRQTGRMRSRCIVGKTSIPHAAERE